MKKWIVGIICILIILVIAFYLVLPSPIRISNRIALKTSPGGAYRTLIKQELWDSASDGSIKITRTLLNTIYLDVITQGSTTSVKLFLIPVMNDSVNITWESSLPIIKGPIAKWHQYSEAIEIRKKMDKALDDFKMFTNKDENIYGIKIHQTSTKDTFLIATKFNTKGYPSTEEIYLQIEKLKSYSKQMNASQTNSPMLNVTKKDSATFQCMVAIPINKIIDGKGSVFFVRMIPGRFLTTQVVGGAHTIAHGHEMMQQYFKDHKRTSMAIPFEYLITDRLMETDTTNWVTKIYGPVY